MVIRAGLLIIAIALALPACHAGWAALKSGAFLAEFLTNGDFPLLTRLTFRPIQTSLLLSAPLRPVRADLYRPARFFSVPGLVLVHGLAPQGKKDPSLQRAARLLSRAGMIVMVPTIEGLTTLRLRPEDKEGVVAAVEQLRISRGVDPQRLSLLGVSVGGGVALLAAADPRISHGVRQVVTLGGYASTRELLRYFLTGAYSYGRVNGLGSPQPEAARHFLLTNLDLLESQADRRTLSRLFESGGGSTEALGAEGQAVYRLLINRDPLQVDALINALPEDLQGLIDNLSPLAVLPQLRARLLLLHSVTDPAIPFTESLRLADAARNHVLIKLVLLRLLTHVEPGEQGPGWRSSLGELATLWSVLYQLLH
ncbi:MAG TPA: hypothetical protein VJO34_01610 [Methylomirabilota bacterium]|nr:hypothetical protein [Methylomirabilota bacterium]